MAELSDATLESLLRLVESKPDAPISREIDPADDMYAGSVEHYFAVSASALRAIRLAMIAGGKTGAEAILDLPSGYGRVLRSRRAAFPQAEITACDLNRGAVDYCAGVFGVRCLCMATLSLRASRSRSPSMTSSGPAPF